ncbi:MAG: hypothetical protein DRO40_11175 [Thermoprotei archaeon]|nr:MAG: hypothetical protein DRO40_11175 [Thermoprotei archaeon]
MYKAGKLPSTYIYLLYSGLVILFSFIIGLGIDMLKEMQVNIPSMIVAGLGASLFMLGLLYYVEKLSVKLKEYSSKREIRRILREEI